MGGKEGSRKKGEVFREEIEEMGKGENRMTAANLCGSPTCTFSLAIVVYWLNNQMPSRDVGFQLALIHLFLQTIKTRSFTLTEGE